MGDRTIENAAWTYPHTSDGRPDLSGHIAFVWDSMDAWYEEDERIFKHPRNPFHRVDAIRSSRHVEVLADGETVAHSQRPTIVFETGLPARFYLPREDVRTELLTPTDSESICPYKGFASYWTLQMGDEAIEDVGWSYETPFPQQTAITDLMCFWPEKDARIRLMVDGELYEPDR